MNEAEARAFQTLTPFLRELLDARSTAAYTQWLADPDSTTAASARLLVVATSGIIRELTNASIEWAGEAGPDSGAADRGDARYHGPTQ